MSPSARRSASCSESPTKISELLQFNPLSALRKTVQWANQEGFAVNENEEPIAFVVFRSTKTVAMWRWTAGGSCGNARMKLANYFNRHFTDHISTHQWDGCGPNDWRWTLEPRSLSSAAIIRMPMTDPMCHRGPKMLLTLNEIIEWGMLATTRGQCLIEWRLMGHTMVPLSQAVGGGLEHDCSTWDEIYENEDNEAANAWNAPLQAKGSNDRNALATALAQTANALEPGAEIGRMPRALSSDRTEPGDKFRSALRLQLFCDVQFYVEMLNGFLQWFAEKEILGFKMNDA